VIDALLKNVKRRMTPQPLKVRADVELTCFHYDGIERIKDAIRSDSQISYPTKSYTLFHISSYLVSVTLIQGS
jgi:translation initiation factor 2 alpha subunit (eIF-2alpha)